MKNPRCIKIAVLLLALLLIEPRVAYADATQDATKAAEDIDKAYNEAQENIPDKEIKEKEDQLDKAARDNDETQGDPAKDPAAKGDPKKGDPAKDPAKEKAQKNEDDARGKADTADPDKTGAPYRKALKDRREACKKLKKALDDLRQQLQKRRKITTDNTDIEHAIRDAQAARERQKKVPQPPTLSMVAPQGAPTLATLVASGKIKIDSAGTGETIGHVVDLEIQNLTGQPINCSVGPMVLESKSRKNQDYVCPTPKTVAINPHGTTTVPINGVCINRNKPPVSKGAPGDLLVNTGDPTAPQNPNLHIPVNQAGDLLRICTAKYNAADQLQKSGALKNLPYHEPQKQKDIVVQWSTWCDPRISQITGAPPATKEDLRKVVYKQAKAPMSPETRKKLDQGIDTIFEKIELTTAKAKDLEKPAEEIPAVAAPAVEQAPSGGVPVAAPRRGTLHPCEPNLKLGEIEGPDELEVGQEREYSVEATSDCGNCYETDGEGGIIAGTFKACKKKLTYKWTYEPHAIGVAGDIEYTAGTEDTKSKIKGKKEGEVLLSVKVWLECEKQSDKCYKMTSEEKKKVITVVPKK